MSKRRTLQAVVVAGVIVLVGAAVAVGQGIGPGDSIFADKENETSKQQIQEEDAALEAIGEASPAPKPDNPEAAGPETDPEDIPVWNEGIYKMEEPFPGGDYDFTTVWQGSEPGMHVRIYAGAYSNKDSIGLVLVDFVDPDTFENTFKGPFESPIPGPLTIEEAKGDVLVLSGAGGATTTFDIRTLSFG